MGCLDSLERDIVAGRWSRPMLWGSAVALVAILSAGLVASWVGDRLRQAVR